MLKAALFFTICLDLVYCSLTEFSHPTQLGNVTGLKGTLEGKTFYSFYGIPYAKPPVGDRRFLKPEPYGPFGERNGTQHGPQCVQKYLGPTFGQEDCLILNVFTPLDTVTKKPVMLFIHGGGQLIGTANQFQGPALVALGDIVLVSINYRLGLFGFLPIEEGPFHSNIGLYDQQLAIQWTKDNIEEFGGDSNDITIFGQSAGAVNVLQHMLSHKNNNTLFQKAIVESNALSTYTALRPRPYYSASELVELFNCDDSSHLLECLQHKTIDDIVDKTLAKQDGMVSWSLKGEYFETGLEKEIEHLLKTPNQHPVNVSKSLKLFGQYHMIAGFLSQEGLSLATPDYLSRFDFAHDVNISEGVTSKMAQTAIEYQFRFTEPQYNGKLAAAILSRSYQGSYDRLIISDTNRRNLAAYVETMGDYFFSIPTLRMLQLHSMVRSLNVKTYGYEIDLIPSWYSQLNEYPNWLRYGGSHSDDVPLIFGFPFLFNATDSLALINSEGIYLPYMRNLTYSVEDIQLARDMISYVTSFAHTGVPTADSRSPWQQFYAENSSYAYITLNETEMRSELKAKELSLWNSVWLAFGDVELNRTSICSTYKSSLLNGIAKLTPEESSGVMTTLIVVLSLVGVVCFVLLVGCISSRLRIRRLQKALNTQQQYQADEMQ